MFADQIGHDPGIRLIEQMLKARIIHHINFIGAAVHQALGARQHIRAQQKAGHLDLQLIGQLPRLP